MSTAFLQYAEIREVDVLPTKKIYLLTKPINPSYLFSKKKKKKPILT
jgi:hypothetical protein